MAAILAAPVWHYWISWVLVGATFLVCVAIAVGYYLRVTNQKYPRQ